MKWHLAAILAATLVSATGLGIVASAFNPFSAGVLVKFLFYSSLFLTFWGAGILLAARFGRLKRPTDLYIPIRRGFLFAFLPLGYSLLARIERFSTVSAIILVAFLALAETFAFWRSRRGTDTEDFS